MMQVLVERGVSKGDCLQKIVNKYGAYFTVLREKTYRPNGFMGLFAREGVELEFCLSPMRGLSSGGGASLGGGASFGSGREDYSSDSSYGSAEKPVSRPHSVAKGGGASLGGGASKGGDTVDFVEAKRRLIAAGGKDPDQVFQKIQEEKEADELILDKLRQIEEKIETGKTVNNPRPEHPNLIRIAEMLRKNDFSERYVSGILEKIRKELSLDTMEDFDSVQERVLVWIGESITIFPPLDFSTSAMRKSKSGRIIVLVGPTGVGKTTTVAKLAALYGPLNAGPNPLSIRMITIDAYKIGAEAQIGKYGDTMDIPVSYVDNHRDLRREIDLYREEADIILVDTIGRGPKDAARLGEMKEILDACGSKAEIHLALSAGTKTSDMEYILQQFEPFNYQALILTKLDETRHLGNVISALAERGKAVSYITDGQEVHKYISQASVIRFLINMEEFRVDREKFEKLFPAAEAEQSQWG